MSSFFWLPGFKGSFMGKDVDIDIIACCDGHLVFAECKDLSCEEVSPTGTLKANGGKIIKATWNHVIEQAQGTVDLAESCGVEIVLLSLRTNEVPAWFVRRVRELSTPRVKLTLVLRSTLEQQASQQMASGWTSIEQLRPLPPRRKRLGIDLTLGEAIVTRVRA